MNDLISVLKAADAAARWHVHQRRKGAAQEPYINHPLEVAALVAEATDGDDPNLIAVALLHDVIEDCGVPYDRIAESFGTDVADLVAEVPQKMPAAERRLCPTRRVQLTPSRADVFLALDPRLLLDAEGKCKIINRILTRLFLLHQSVAPHCAWARPRRKGFCAFYVA